jgi:hypothetical protein
VKVLTVHNPWAWLIVRGLKRIENRSRPTKHRGPLLVHAGRTYVPDVPLPPEAPPVETMPYSAIVGRVTLLDCVPLADAAPGPHTHGPFCWLLGDAVAFEQPIVGADGAPLKGQVGLWNFNEQEDVTCDHCHGRVPTMVGVAETLCAKCGKVFQMIY